VTLKKQLSIEHIGYRRYGIKIVIVFTYNISMMIDGKNIAKAWKKKLLVCIKTLVVFWRVFINLTFRNVTR